MILLCIDKTDEEMYQQRYQQYSKMFFYLAADYHPSF